MDGYSVGNSAVADRGSGLWLVGASWKHPIRPGGFRRPNIYHRRHRPRPRKCSGCGLAPAIGQATFQLDYQAFVPALIGANGQDFTPPGLGSTYQLTVVGSFTEVVTGLYANGTVATFSMAASQSNSFFELYYNSSVVANNLAGTGFNVGTLVIAGTPATNLPSESVFSLSSSGSTQPFDQFDQNNYAGIQSVVGSGALMLWANTTYYNPAFVGTPISEMAFNFSLVTPFDEVDPSRLFVGSPWHVNSECDPQYRHDQRRQRDRFPVPDRLEYFLHFNSRTVQRDSRNHGHARRFCLAGCMKK